MEERVGDMYEEPEKRDVMDNKYKKVNVMKERVGDKYKKPEERDMFKKPEERDMYKKTEERDIMGDINPKDSYDKVNVGKEKVGDMHEKLNKSKSKKDEYEAGVKAHQGRKPNMYEKPETRDVMIKTNPDGKHDEVTMVRERGNVRQGQTEQLLKVLGYKFIADEQDLQRGAQEDCQA
jgi:hypothetical protein